MLYLRFRPSITTQERLQRFEAAREDLDRYVGLPAEYQGELRRHVLARSIHYSTAIEGNTLTLRQVEGLLAGEAVAAPEAQIQEVENYREAIGYVQSLAAHGVGAITEDHVRTIHYLVSKSLPSEYAPGRYRTQQNYVIDRISQRRLFLPPPPDRVPDLMRELIEWLAQSRELPAVYRAALSHLNLVAIHPFTDGNGRTARILETLVLYQGGYKAQELVSLEAFFGRDTQQYYRAIANSLGPRFAPEHADVTPWIDYYLDAHAEQAWDTVNLIQEMTRELDTLWESFKSEGVTTWQSVALWLACRNGQVSNKVYQASTGRSHQSAAQDFRRLIDLNLLARKGKGRSTQYVPTERVRTVFQALESGPTADTSSP